MKRGWKMFGIFGTLVLAVAAGAVLLAPLFRLPIEVDASELEPDHDEEWIGA